MRGRTIPLRERSASVHNLQLDEHDRSLQQKRKLSKTTSHNSLSNNLTTKMDFTEKMERYKVLLEKEYRLRAKLAREYGEPATCRHNEQSTLICNCGRRISPTTGSPLVSSARDAYLQPKSQHFVRLRSKSEKIKRTECVRPLSADISLEAPSSAARRKLAAEEKMGKRRESLRLLEGDFEKAKDFMARARAHSNGSAYADKPKMTAVQNDENSKNNNNNDSNNNNDHKNNTGDRTTHGYPDKTNNYVVEMNTLTALCITKRNILTPLKTSNDSGVYSSNESVASTSSMEMSNAVTNYINRRKERPLSCYL